MSRTLREARSVMVSRVENLVLVALIAVMVLRPIYIVRAFTAPASRGFAPANNKGDAHASNPQTSLAVIACLGIMADVALATDSSNVSRPAPTDRRSRSS